MKLKIATCDHFISSTASDEKNVWMCWNWRSWVGEAVWSMMELVVLSFSRGGFSAVWLSPSKSTQNTIFPIWVCASSHWCHPDHHKPLPPASISLVLWWLIYEICTFIMQHIEQRGKKNCDITQKPIDYASSKKSPLCMCDRLHESNHSFSKKSDQF